MTSRCNAHKYYDSECQTCVSTTDFTNKKPLVLTREEILNRNLFRAALRMKNRVVVLGNQEGGVL